MKFPSVTYKGVGGLEFVWLRYFRKRETRASWNVWTGGILCLNEKHTNKKKRENLRNAWSNIPSLRMNIEDFFEIAARIKKHPLLSTSKNNESYQGKMPFIITCENKRPGERGRLAPPPLLSNWGYKGQSESAPVQADEERTSVSSVHSHRCLEIADCCGFRVETFPSKALV